MPELRLQRKRWARHSEITALDSLSNLGWMASGPIAPYELIFHRASLTSEEVNVTLNSVGTSHGGRKWDAVGVIGGVNTSANCLANASVEFCGSVI